MFNDFLSYITLNLANGLMLVFMFVFLIQLLYYWVIFSRLAFFKNKKYISDNKPVSIIVCARNEYKNLDEFLPKILEQKYPKFEVLLVNDDNETETDFLLSDLKLKYKNFRVIDVNNSISFIKGKKFAISVGIKTSSYDKILLTDADCYPSSENWLMNMQAAFSDKKEIVIGYNRYEREKGFFNKLVRFDCACNAIKYLSFCAAGIPYKGVGQNLAYTKSLFNKQNGFTSHYSIPYGDDDIFVNKSIIKNNAVPVYNHDSHTISIAPKSYDVWLRQKYRNFITRQHYRFLTQLSLGFYNFSTYLFYILLILLPIIDSENLINLIVISGMFFVRLISQILIFKGALEKLNEKGLILLVPFFELFFLFYNPIMIFSKSFNQNKWK